MKFLQLPFCIMIVILMPYGLTAYPVFGLKRYERSTNPQPSWGMSSVVQVPSYYYQTIPRFQNYHPLSYYDAMNVYAPDYDDYYYSQDSLNYPVYYPTFARTGSNNYDLYQPMVPYYYSLNPYNYYESTDPMEDLQDEVLQEEREQREEAYPIGQETWYEPNEESKQSEIDEVNAAFMKNLMLYNKAVSQSKHQPIDSYVDEQNWKTNPKNIEDEDEYELKMLNESPKKNKPNKQTEAQTRMKLFEKNNRNTKSSRYSPNNSESWLNYNNKRNSQSTKITKTTSETLGRKPQKSIEINDITTTPASNPTILKEGQKEVVMMRPATPVRRPFAQPVVQLLNRQATPERKRSPSVFDTIKHMLELEKNLEKEYNTKDVYRPAMRKRYVSTEESLVQELSNLKRTA